MVAPSPGATLAVESLLPVEEESHADPASSASAEALDPQALACRKPAHLRSACEACHERKLRCDLVEQLDAGAPAC